MTKYKWVIEIGNKRQEVEFIQTSFWGKLALLVDGAIIQEWKRFSHIFPLKQWLFRFQIDERECVLFTALRGFRIHANLVVDGEVAEPAYKRTYSPSIVITSLFLIEACLFLFVISFYIVLGFFSDGPYTMFKAPLFGIRVTFLLSLGLLVCLLAAGLLLHVSTRITGHQAFRWITLLLSSWFFLSSMFLWAESDHEIIGIIQSIRQGLSPWMLLVPISSGLIMLVVAVHPPGHYIFLYPLILVLAIATLFVNSPAPLTNVQGLSKGLGWNSSMVASLLLMFSIGYLAIRGDHPPITSWLARIQYYGVYDHYVSLYRLAYKHRLMIAEPSRETGGAIYVRGLWKNRQLNAGINQECLVVSVSSEKNLWPFRLFAGYRNIEVDEEEGRLIHEMEDSRGQRAILMLWPPEASEIDTSHIAPLAIQIEKGKEYLDGVIEVSSAGDSIDFHRRRAIRLPKIYADFEGLIGWLLSVAEFMEDSGFCREVFVAEGNDRKKVS